MELCQVVAENFPLCASWTVLPGDRVALAGPAGCGKSLQLDVIAKKALIASGHITFAPEVRRLALCRRDLQPRATAGDLRTVREWLHEDCELSGCSLVEVSESPDEHQEPERWLQHLGIACLSDCALSDLSAIDAVKVGIARLAMWHPNVLLLDDVTDDLDVEASECLEACLTADPPIFETILIASRDRSFMDNVCNKVIAIHAGATRVLNGVYTKAYLAGGDFLHFRRFSLWQPKSSGLRATQAACAFASLISRSLCGENAADLTGLTLVDVGTGTGVLALILAQEWEKARGSLKQLQIYALDIDETAVRIAAANFSASPWAANMYPPFHSSLEHWQMDQIATQEQEHPIVFVCNPPYDDEILNARTGTDNEKLSRRRALERSFLPLDVLCTTALGLGCRSLWILWGNAEDARL